GAVITGVFSACSSEPKTVQYYEDPKNATELEAKIKECDKNANLHILSPLLPMLIFY
ncbi:EexN family lipoprotein, partial [Campylobacter coli]|nr:EexN family lipoprotein [Campylobacter coli]